MNYFERKRLTYYSKGINLKFPRRDAGRGRHTKQGEKMINSSSMEKEALKKMSLEELQEYHINFSFADSRKIPDYNTRMRLIQDELSSRTPIMFTVEKSVLCTGDECYHAFCEDSLAYGEGSTEKAAIADLKARM